MSMMATTGVTAFPSRLWRMASALGMVMALGIALLPAPPVAGQATPAPPSYEIHQLPTLGGDEGSVVEVNNAGVAVGWSELRPGDDAAHATMWAGGAPLDLGALGGDESFAWDVNDAGVVAGSARTETGAQHAVLWRDGEITDLGTLGGENSRAQAINEQGAVVGASETASGDVRAFLWQDGEMTDLGTLGGAESDALTIAGNGVVYGSADLAAGPPQAAMWSGSLVTALGGLGGEAARAMAANASGVIVGFASDPDGVDRALVWRDGVRVPLRLDPDDPIASAAIAVNAAGTIAGSIAPATPGMRGVIWRNGERYPLPSLAEGKQSGAFTVSDAGVGGGYARDASGRQWPVLWVPVSAPIPAALVGGSHVATPAATVTPVSLAEAPAAATQETEAGDGDRVDGAAVSNQLTVESYDIYFEPAEIEAPANTEVTILLPNLGRTPHNFTIDALGISVDIMPGETQEVTFTAPEGEYEFFCNVPGHRAVGMVGTLMVRAENAATARATPSAAVEPPNRSFVWDQVDVTVELREDGSFHVTERVRVAFTGGPFQVGFREIPLTRIERVDHIRVGEVEGEFVKPYRFVTPETFSRDVPNTYTWQEVGPNLRIDWSITPATSETRAFQIEYDAFGALRVHDDAEPPYQEISWIGVDTLLTETAPVDEASLTFVLPRQIRPGFVAIEGPGGNDLGAHTDDLQTWVWRASDLGSGDSLAASLKFLPLVDAEAPAWQAASDPEGDAATPVPDATPAPAATPVARATPVAGNADLPPCREVMENDFPGQRRDLLADCVTDRPIFVPEGWVFDGGGHAISARDPVGGRLSGGVVTVSGDGSTVRNVTVDGSGLTAPCLVDYGATALTGVLVYGSGGEVTGVTVRNVMRAMPDTGGAATSQADSLSCGSGIDVVGDGAEAFIQDSAVANVGFAGVTIDAGAASVSNNTIANAAEIGILGMNGANVRLSPGNHISAGKAGIQLEGSGTGGRIAGNTVAAMTGDGIAVIQGARASVAENMVEDADSGIAAGSRATVDVRENTVVGAADNGILVTDSGTRATIETNTIDASRRDGIWVQSGAEATIAGNTVAAAARHGIAVLHDGTRATIDGNTVTDAAENGILLVGGANADIAENRVSGAVRGIEVNGVGTSATVTGNLLERIGTPGISINSGATAPDVSGNTVTGAQFGIVVLGTGTTATVADNTVSDLSGTGFTVESGAAAELRGNDISQAPGGILVTSAGTTADLVENRIEGTTSRGIIIKDGARATVSGNTLLQPGTTGISIDDAGPVTLQGNTIEGARGAGIRLQPAPAAPSDDAAVILASRDIFYEPDAITIRADTEVRLLLPNFGVTVHNVTIAALGIDVDIQPGETEEVIVNAPAGTYEIVCNVPGHRQAGQVATLTVAAEGEDATAAADVIRDNEISGGEYGIVIAGGGANAAVMANRISGIASSGVAVEHGARALVEGNIVSEVGAGINVVGAGSSATVVGNRVSDILRNGIDIHDGAEATVRQNVVTRAANGIVINEPRTTATLAGNIVSASVDNGIVVQRAATAAIQEGNVVSGGQWSLLILGKGTSADVRDNRFSAASNQVISVMHGASATITGNVVQDGDSGIYVRYAGSRVVVDKNVISAETEGIAIRDGGTGERIAGNTVSGGRTGIAIVGRDARAVIEDNRVSGFAREGIVVRDGAVATVSGNRVQDNRLGIPVSGIAVSGRGTAATVTRNEISDLAGVGIQIGPFATGTVRANTIAAVSQTGIRVVRAERGALIGDNTLREAGTVGIEVHLSEIEIRDNTIVGSTFAGIQLGPDVQAEVSDNTIVGPAAPNADEPGPYGVQIQPDASGYVNGNTISGLANNGAACGIRVDAAPDMTVAGNTFPGDSNDLDVCETRAGATAPAPAATPIAPASPVPAVSAAAATPVADE